MPTFFITFNAIDGYLPYFDAVICKKMESPYLEVGAPLWEYGSNSGCRTEVCYSTMVISSMRWVAPANLSMMKRQ